jgi:hypothetical protein
MRLPPFSSLIALEAAARHKSYSRAADELFVTHGAVSQQVRKLEEDLTIRVEDRLADLSTDGSDGRPAVRGRSMAGDRVGAPDRRDRPHPEVRGEVEPRRTQDLSAKKFNMNEIC